MSSQKKFTIVLLLLYFCLAGCQTSFGQYRFDSWTTDNGLPQNGLREITQTPDGYLWFTTFDGLVRFDGVRFTTFNKANTRGIINSRFTGLFSDKDGTLWATTMENGVLTVYKDGVFSSYNSDQVPGHYIIRTEYDEKGELRFLVEDEDRTSKSWYYLCDGNFVFSEKLGKSEEKKYYQSKSGAYWTITRNQTTEMHNGKLTTYPVKIKEPSFNVSFYEDREGNLWLGENNVYRLRNGEIKTYGEKDGLPGNTIYHKFWQEVDGSVWFASGASYSSGTGLIQYKDGQLHIWKDEGDFSDTSVFNVFKDREGTTWLATNRGLKRLRKKLIKGYSTKDGLNHSEVYPIYRDRKGNILIGTTKGLNIYRNGKFESLKLKQSGKPVSRQPVWVDGKMSVQSLWEDPQGKIWIGLNGCIFISQNGRAEMLTGSDGHHVFAIQQDSSGNVWAATNKGLLVFKDYKLINRYSVKNGLPNDFMTLIFQDSKGGLWFGSHGGLSKFTDSKFINYTTQNGLVGNYIRAIYEDSEGTFWIGTYDEGMSRFKNGRFVNINTENGLYNNGVFAIQEDKSGNFWISSNHGIYRVKRQELNDFANRKIAKINSVGYGKEDGMLSTECNGGRQPASIKDNDGNFWFPTQNGVAIVTPEAESSNPLSPSVVIESASVEREQVDIRKGIVIEPGQKNIEIRYTGLSLVKSDQIKFKYKLEGHDPDWIEAGTRRTAYYSYLPPGNYRFQVIAANSDGIWNEKGVSIELELKPSFYQTRSFYLLCLSIATLALFLIWQISVYQLKMRERRLTKIVNEKTKALKQANKILHTLATSDGLTGVANRRRFEEFLTDEWHRAIRFKTEISLILIDIDYFKLYNDNYGHKAGDECLKKVAFALNQIVKRPTDIVARYGGEEFVIVLGGTDSEGAVNIAEQAVSNVASLKIPHGKSKASEYITISVGISTTFAKAGMTDSDLVNASDMALYQAKENGRNQIHIFDFLTQTAEPSVLQQEHVEVG